MQKSLNSMWHIFPLITFVINYSGGVYTITFFLTWLSANFLDFYPHFHSLDSIKHINIDIFQASSLALFPKINLGKITYSSVVFPDHFPNGCVSCGALYFLNPGSLFGFLLKTST